MKDMYNLFNSDDWKKIEVITCCTDISEVNFGLMFKDLPWLAYPCGD